MATVPNQVPLYLDLNTGRVVRNDLGVWKYGPIMESETLVIDSGASSTVPDNTAFVSIDPASLLAAYALTFPANPVDGDQLTINFGGQIAAGSNVITALTLTANTGQSIDGDAVDSPVTSGTAVTFRYTASNTTWTLIYYLVGAA